MRDNNPGTPAHLRNYLPHMAEVAATGQGAGTDDEESCPAFGFLRGMDARALAVEFRLRSGNSEWFAYSCLVSWRFNPSVGLLLKFTGDVATLVLIHGSNLDAPVGSAKVNLTDRGLQRHRINYIREMDEDELRKAHQRREPTIDRIDIAEFDTVEEQREWLKAHAPAFVRKVT
jgi:hypothetical protein